MESLSVVLELVHQTNGQTDRRGEGQRRMSQVLAAEPPDSMAHTSRAFQRHTFCPSAVLLGKTFLIFLLP